MNLVVFELSSDVTERTLDLYKVEQFGLFSLSLDCMHDTCFDWPIVLEFRNCEIWCGQSEVTGIQDARKQFLLDGRIHLKMKSMTTICGTHGEA